MRNSVENRIISGILRLAIPIVILFVILSIEQIKDNNEEDKKIEEYIHNFDYDINSVKPSYISFYLKNDSIQGIPQSKIIVFTSNNRGEVHFALKLNKALNQSLIANKKIELKTIVVTKYAENDDVEIGFIDHNSGELIAIETLEHHSYLASHRNRRTGSITKKYETYPARFEDIVKAIESRVQSVPDSTAINGTPVKKKSELSNYDTTLYLKKNRLHMSMIFVKGGTFQMGSDDRDDDNPARAVRLSDFYIGKFEVTQKQWRDVMSVNPSSHRGCDNCPVESMSWEDVQLFLIKANEKFHEHYRLPTSAEWEYAARGGIQSKNYTFSGSNIIDEVAWYGGNSIRTRRVETHQVGQKKPNDLGIYDMSGNVWEWVSDWYEENKSDSHPPTINPKGPSTGSFHMSRGGSAQEGEKSYCTVSYSSILGLYFRDQFSGFRVVVSE